MATPNKKVIELLIDDEECLNAIALVKNPAIEVNWKAFSSNRVNVTLATVNTEKRIITGPAMIPNKEILRYDEKTNEEYYVYFSTDTIRKMAEKYLIEKKNDSVNLEHESPIDDVSIVESWLVMDSNNDKAKALGYTVPVDTWMISMKVNNDDIWNDIKDNKYSGFSIEGWFIEKFSEQKQSEEDILLEKIKNILSQA